MSRLEVYDLNNRSHRYLARKHGIDVPKQKPGPRPKDFLSFVDKTTDCWNWMGLIDPYGYGLYQNNGVHKAHRWSWSSINGEIPNGLFICHKCDNPKCVNPEHLFLGTHQDNMADRNSKGRQARGSRNGHAKLTETQVLELMKAYKEIGGKRNGSLQKLADKYGIKIKTISVIARRDWRHILES